MTRWELFVFTFFNAQVMAATLPRIVEGFFLTVWLALLTVASGLALGLALAVIRSFGVRPLNWAIIFLVDLFRALPPLVIIVLIYFGLPSLGPAPSGFVSTWISLTLVLAAFAEEIVWGGILAVPRGQWEAARSTGLGFAATLAHVVLPQALRISITPLTSRTIELTKGAALGSGVAVAEILSVASGAVAVTSNPSPLTLGAIAYLILFIPVVAAGRWVETRFAWKR